MALPGSDLWRDLRFITLAATMALGLFAQIELLTHLFSLLVTPLGTQLAGIATGAATAAAIAGRYDWVPASMRRTLGAASRRPLSVGGTKSVGHRARRFFEALGGFPRPALLGTLGYVSPT